MLPCPASETNRRRGTLLQVGERGTWVRIHRHCRVDNDLAFIDRVNPSEWSGLQVTEQRRGMDNTQITTVTNAMQRTTTM